MFEFELFVLVFVITGGSLSALDDISFVDNDLLALADADESLNGSTDVVSLYLLRPFPDDMLVLVFA